MLEIHAADERDSGWEISDPRFRVFFFERGSGSHSSRAFDLRGCDVLQAVDWARANAMGRTFSVALVDDPVRSDDANRGLRWILGIDANDSATTDWSAEAKLRMEDGFPPSS